MQVIRSESGSFATSDVQVIRSDRAIVAHAVHNPALIATSGEQVARSARVTVTRVVHSPALRLGDVTHVAHSSDLRRSRS